MKHSMNIKKLSLLALFACISISGITYGADDARVTFLLDQANHYDIHEFCWERQRVYMEGEKNRLLEEAYQTVREPLSKKAYAQGLAYGILVPLASTVATITTIKVVNPELTAKDCISLVPLGLFLSSSFSGLYHAAMIPVYDKLPSQKNKRLIANVQSSAMTALLSLIMLTRPQKKMKSSFFEANYKGLVATTLLANVGYNIIAPILPEIIRQFLS